MPPREFEAKHRWMECEDSAKPPPFRLVILRCRVEPGETPKKGAGWLEI